MTQNDQMKCQKCGQTFSNQNELKEHAKHCTGQGAQQGNAGRPMTHGAGGGTRSTE